MSFQFKLRNIIRPIKPLVIFKNTLTEIYIGVTWKTLIQRFIEHTEDAIEANIINSDWPNRLIECLILRALEIYITETYSYSSEISPLSYNFAYHALIDKYNDEDLMQYGTNFEIVNKENMKVQLKKLSNPVYSKNAFMYNLGRNLIKHKYGEPPSYTPSMYLTSIKQILNSYISKV